MDNGVLLVGLLQIFVFEEGDELIIAGSSKNINSIVNKTDDAVDITTVLTDALNEE